VRFTYLRVDEMLDAWLQHLVRVLGPMDAMIARAGRDFQRAGRFALGQTINTRHGIHGG